MRKRLLRLFLGLRALGPIVTPRFRPPQEHPWRVPGRTVFVGDEEFLVRRTGVRDGPTVVLVHGLGGSSLGEWYKVARLLAARHDVVLIDHRSHGLSPKVTDRFEMADLADDLAGVMDTLELGPAVVAGYSMGGAVAQELAHRHPHRVTGMILIGTFTHHPPSWRWPRTIFTVLTRAFERLFGVGTAEVRAGYLLAVGAVEARHARWAWEETHRRDIEAGAAASLATLRFDSRSWVGRIGMPVTVMIPTRDQLVPPSWQYQLAARLPDVRVVEIDGARHEAPWTHPDHVASAVEEMVEAVRLRPEPS